MTNTEVQNAQTEKLERIDWDIQKNENTLQDLQGKLSIASTSEESQLLQKQINEVQASLERLKKEKQDIITQSQTSLWEVSSTQAEQINHQLNNAWLSSEERAQAQAYLESWDAKEATTIEWGVLWFILALLQAIMWAFKGDTWNDDVDADDIDPTTGQIKVGRNPRSVEIKSMDKREYVLKAKEYAKEVEATYGIPWEICVAQSVLESNWGRSWLSRAHNNYFGIKAVWSEASVRMATREHTGWRYVTIPGAFRTYWDMRESFLWYGEFLTRNQRYKEAFAYSSDTKFYHGNASYKQRDPVRFITEIKRAWYATDPNYISSVMGVANSISEIA